MIKKEDRESVKTKNFTIRFSPSEIRQIQKKAKVAGTSFSNYCRSMSLEGHILERANPNDLNEVRLLRKCLIEYKTNFSRISNLIDVSSPLLNGEVKEVKGKLEGLLKKFQLW